MRNTVLDYGFPRVKELSQIAGNLGKKWPFLSKIGHILCIFENRMEKMKRNFEDHGAGGVHGSEGTSNFEELTFGEGSCEQ